MLDQYQISLTRMLESEQYGEAKELLGFLLHCQGKEKHHYEEWKSLLEWLDMAFPDGDYASGGNRGDVSEEPTEEKFRQELLNPPQQDEAYVNQVMYIMQHHPMIDQQMLALERAAYLAAEQVSDFIRNWLQEDSSVHPMVQFKALQCLKKRGASGEISLHRMGEAVKLEIEDTPMSLEEFPHTVLRILERTEQVAENDDPTLPHFARELWKESLQFLYGTSAYSWMLRDDEETTDCYAAALHLTLQLTVYGSANDDDNRDTYGITESLRFRYEQACRTLRSVAMLLHTEDNEHPT